MNYTKQITHGLSVDYVEGGRIAVLKITDNSRDTLDAWGEAMLQVVGDWAEHDPYRVLFDTSDPKLTFTPYFRAKSLEVMAVQFNKSGYMGIVFNNRFYARMVEFFMKAQRHKEFEFRSFTDYTQGLNWLKLMMKD